MKTFVTGSQFQAGRPVRPVGLILAIVSMLSASLCSAQWVPTAGPDGGPVNVLVHRASDGNVFAGTYGGVFRSAGGPLFTWTEATVGIPPSVSVSGITFSTSEIYASGTSPQLGGGVYKSTDNGVTWTSVSAAPLPSGLVAIMNDVAVSGSRVLVSASNLLGGGGVYASTDAGSSWTASNKGLPAGFTPGKLFVTGSDVYVAGTSSPSTLGVYRSTDNGSSWTAANGGFPTSSFVTAFSAIGTTVFAATNSAGVWRTTNSGGAWTKISPTSPVLIVGATALTGSATNLYIGAGRVWKADANGENWQQVITGLPTPNAGTSIPTLLRSGSNLVAAVSRLGLYASTNDGADWSGANSGLRAGKINSLYISGSTIYAAENTTGYSRSGDGGASWARINQGFDIANTNGYYGFAETGGYLVGGAGGPGILRSSDGGNSWGTVTGAVAAPAYGLTEEGGEVFGGTLGTILKSTDNGGTWTSLTTGYPGFAVVSAVWKDGQDMLSGSNGGVKRSTDGGGTWTAPVAGLPGFGNTYGFAVVDTMIFLGHDGGVYVSTDRGASWTSVSTGIGLGIPARAIGAIGQFLYIGTTQGVFESTNLGASWTTVNQGFPVGMSVGTLTDDGAYLYAGTDYHGTWKRPLSELSDVGDAYLRGRSDGIPSRSSLHNAYPNPFNPSTEIGFDVAGPDYMAYVKIEVYDVLGRTTATLVDGEMEVGSYSVRWDAAGASGGIYFVRMNSGSYVAVRRLVLVK